MASGEDGIWGNLRYVCIWENEHGMLVRLSLAHFPLRKALIRSLVEKQINTYVVKFGKTFKVVDCKRQRDSCNEISHLCGRNHPRFKFMF